MLLYSSWVTYSCFHPLYASYFLFEFLHPHRPPGIFLPDFLFIGLDYYWAWRMWSLIINQLSWAPLPSRALFCRTLLSRFLKKPISLLLYYAYKVEFCFSLSSLPSGSWTPPSHGPCSQGCLWSSHFQEALPWWWDEVQQSISSDFLLSHLEVEVITHALQEPSRWLMVIVQCLVR